MTRYITVAELGGLNMFYFYVTEYTSSKINPNHVSKPSDALSWWQLLLGEGS